MNGREYALRALNRIILEQLRERMQELTELPHKQSDLAKICVAGEILASLKLLGDAPTDREIELWLAGWEAGHRHAEHVWMVNLINIGRGRRRSAEAANLAKSEAAASKLEAFHAAYEGARCGRVSHSAAI